MQHGCLSEPPFSPWTLIPHVLESLSHVVGQCLWLPHTSQEAGGSRLPVIITEVHMLRCLLGEVIC